MNKDDIFIFSSKLFSDIGYNKDNNIKSFDIGEIRVSDIEPINHTLLIQPRPFSDLWLLSPILSMQRVENAYTVEIGYLDFKRLIVPPDFRELNNVGINDMVEKIMRIDLRLLIKIARITRG